MIDVVVRPAAPVAPGSVAFRHVAVLKLGGSVLSGPAGYAAAASHVAARLARDPLARFVVVVSAEFGHTDALCDEAAAIGVVNPGLSDRVAPDPALLDLLWSTGETRSVALLSLRLRALGASVIGLAVHETGVERVPGCDGNLELSVNPHNLLRAFASHRVVVVPGFVALERQRIVTLGRGGSDRSAVLLAVALGAERCELIKDVDGYFTADPVASADAKPIAHLSCTTALSMADDGCGLVQRHALAEAARARLPLVIRSLASPGTLIQESSMEFATTAIHFNQPTDPATGSIAAPIYQTATYEQEGPGDNRGYDYSRTNNPTRQRLEGVLAELERGRHCAVFGSGLAAEHAILQAYLRPGDSILVPLDVYGGTFRLLHRVFEPLGCTIASVDFSDLEAVRCAITPATRLVWLESPTNPRLLVYDIRSIAAIAHQGHALVVVDNTFATPYFQQPLELGADLVVHSVTKYLAGHSDVIQGAVVASDVAVFEPVRFLQNALGGVPGAFDCWLTLRGLKTLELRMDRHAATARALADTLQAHPRVTRAYYPGLPSHPGHAIAAAQMSGFGGMVSFELDGTPDEAVRLASSLRYFALGESLGGVRALVSLPARMTHASIPAETRLARGLSETLIRLSPGVEGTCDLVADIVAGLAALTSEPSPAAARYQSVG